MPNSCLSCPSYLATNKVPSKFKKSIGAPVCGRYGHVLGRHGATDIQTEKIAKHYGSTCISYGEPLPPLPEEKRLQIALPDPNAMTELPADDTRRTGCSSCLMCVNYVTDSAVAEGLGYTTGLCAAKGKLILPNNASTEARGCEYRQFGSTRKTVEGVELLPEFKDAFSLTTDPVKQFFKAKAAGVFVEPHEYPTDSPVTDEHTSKGIRAWRRMTDPDGSGMEVFLPVYEITHFSDEEQLKIPRTGDEEHPEDYIDHFGGGYMAGVCWTELDETPALWGQAGVGKTELFRYLAWLMCLPFERISITRTTEIDDLAGKMLYTKEKGTYFQYGRLPRAWNKPCVVVIDEPNTGEPEVWQFLRPLTDNSKQLVLDMNEGERISRHDDCYLGMAMNPSWDSINVGAQEIGDADANRLVHISLGMPPESIEREILKKATAHDGWEVDEKRLKAIMQIAVEIRGLCAEGTLPITWGIRPQKKVVRAMRWFEPVTAYRRAIADFLEPEAAAALLDVVKANIA